MWAARCSGPPPWRIETIFKAWKSHFRITQVPHGSPQRLRLFIYARLLFLTAMLPFCTQSWQHACQAHPTPPRSLLKVAALVGDFFLPLCLESRWWAGNTIARGVGRFCGYAAYGVGRPPSQAAG